MATWTAAPSLALLGRSPEAARARRRLAQAVEPRRHARDLARARACAAAHASATGRAFRTRTASAIAEPMQEIVSLLRDPDIEIPDEALGALLALATHPASPAFGPYPIQARFAAHSLLDDLRPTVDGTSRLEEGTVYNHLPHVDPTRSLTPGIARPEASRPSSGASTASTSPCFAPPRRRASMAPTAANRSATVAAILGLVGMRR